MTQQSPQPDLSGSRKRVILMRGLPSCGKSWTAKRLAREQGGQAFEFDEFFVDDDGSSGPEHFRWRRRELPQARLWHFGRVSAAIDAGVSPVVVDDNHRPGPSAKAITAYAILAGYEIEFAEPDSAWWKAIRPLLDDKLVNAEGLARWAQKLCLMNRSTHNVSLASFVARIENWDSELTPIDLLAWGEQQAKQSSQEHEAAA